MPLPLIDRIETIVSTAKDFASAAQSLCSALRAEIPHYHWVGIYWIENGDTLVLKAWDGPAATEHARIPVGQGICGLAAREARTVVVDDVNRDPRYLPCFLHTKSEIVVPIFAKGKVVGEIDIDSDRPAAFNATDRMFLEWCAERLGEVSAR